MHLSRFLALLTSLFLLWGCARAPATTQVPLRIGYSAWPGFLAGVIAADKGYFEQEGVQVSLEFSDNTTTQIADFTAGKLDGAFLALGSVVSLTVQNPQAAVVLISDESQGADAVVAKPGIPDVPSLKGKRIGTNTGGFGELFVTQMLEMHGLTREDVTLVRVIAEDVPAALGENTIDAGSSWEPYISQAVAKGAQVIFDSGSTPGLIPDGLVVSADVWKNRPKELEAFIRAWFRAVDDWLADPAAGSALIAEKLGIPIEEASLEGIKLLTLKDNLAAFVPAQSPTSIHYTAKLYSDFFIRTGNLSRPVDLNVLLNDRFVKAAVPTP